MWRKANEGTDRGCTAKGSACGSGGRRANLLVCISYGHGVCHITKYEKMNGEFFTSFVKNEFPELFRWYGKSTRRLWLQDGDASQNCKSAQNARKSIGAQLISIPPRSPDLNPIENVFHIAVKALERDTMTKQIVCESYEQFVDRIIPVLYSIPCSVINKIIDSVSKRIDLLIANKGKRLKY